MEVRGKVKGEEGRGRGSSGIVEDIDAIGT